MLIDLKKKNFTPIDKILINIMLQICYKITSLHKLKF